MLENVRRTLDGHENYTKFIIVGRSRTGSNLLRGLLNSHSQIAAYGEVFQNYSIPSIEWDHMGYFQSKNIPRLMRVDPVKFLDKKLFGKYPAHIRAVGFKIFYYHAQTESWQFVWPYLQEHREIKVLHIKRENLLKTHISWKKAMLTDSWVDTGNSAGSEATVALDFEECVSDFMKTIEGEKRLDILFADHPILNLTYESLASDYANVMEDVQNFLGVQYEEVKPKTQKQSTKTLSQSIANYTEIRSKFTGTEWERFFDE